MEKGCEKIETEEVKGLSRIFPGGYQDWMGPVYAVGGSVRDHILGRHCHDHDFVVPGDAGVFTRKVADLLGAKVFTLGSGDKANHRMVWGRDTFDFSAMAGETIEDDLKRRDFTINALAYDMKAERLLDPLGGVQDICSRTIRLVSAEAIVADPLRMLRAFRFAAVLRFEIAPDTSGAIGRQRGLITAVAGERIRSEFYSILDHPHCCVTIKHMADVGLLTEIFPELAPTMGCNQNEIHGQDVFRHTLGVLARLEDVLADCDTIWPYHASLIRAYLDIDGRRILLKWSALFHDLGKPACRQIDAAGKVRFIGHEKDSVRLGRRICSRLKMSNRDKAFITYIVVEHLKPLLLFNARKKGHLTSRGLFRFIRRHSEHVTGLLIHGLADQQGKAGAGENLVREFKAFTDEVFDIYFSKIRPNMEIPRLVTGNDLMKHFGLAPSRLIGKVLHRLEEARIRGDISTKTQALEEAARFIEMEGDAGIEPATPSSGGLCSIR